MHIKDNLINFLYDKNYFVSFYEHNLYIFNYEELIHLGSENIILKMPNFILNILGDNLYISKMLPKEILITGKITNIRMDYE